MARSSRTTALLFVILGALAAFAVSVIARLDDDGPSDTPFSSPARALADPSDVRVEVLNGAGTAGLARDATQRLRTDGFDVVYFGNADSFGRGRSVVLDRVGDPGRARAVAGALGIDSVASVRDSTLVLDVTVVLGADWPPPEKPPGLLERLLP